MACSSSILSSTKGDDLVGGGLSSKVTLSDSSTFMVCGELMKLSAKEAWKTIEDYVQCDKQWKILTSTIFDQSIANLKAQLVGNEMVKVEIHRCMSWLGSTDACDENIEVEETLGTPMEVQPLDHMKLKDVGLDTFNHDIPFSSREVPSFDEPEPQPQPLPNCPYLDVSLGHERGHAPSIKQ
ncbi:hypothetical protein Tco_0126569 [Tanacetum coccineum]